ncbi:MAG: hypothetical protein R3B70_05040 [Polyangiaceae bacterium]
MPDAPEPLIAEPFGPPITRAPDASARPGDEPCFPLGRGPGRVSLLEHPDPLCRQRVFLGLARDGAEHAYEIEAGPEQGLVDSLLALHRGSPAPQPGRIRFVHDAPIFGCIQYFEIPEDAPFAQIAMRLSRILKGEVAGLYGEAIRQSAFHSAHGAYELLFRACGSPPVVVCRGQPTAFPALSGGWEGA